MEDVFRFVLFRSPEESTLPTIDLSVHTSQLQKSLRETGRGSSAASWKSVARKFVDSEAFQGDPRENEALARLLRIRDLLVSESHRNSSLKEARAVFPAHDETQGPLLNDKLREHIIDSMLAILLLPQHQRNPVHLHGQVLQTAKLHELIAKGSGVVTDDNWRAMLQLPMVWPEGVLPTSSAPLLGEAGDAPEGNHKDTDEEEHAIVRLDRRRSLLRETIDVLMNVGPKDFEHRAPLEGDRDGRRRGIPEGAQVAGAAEPTLRFSLSRGAFDRLLRDESQSLLLEEHLDPRTQPLDVVVNRLHQKMVKAHAEVRAWINTPPHRLYGIEKYLHTTSVPPQRATILVYEPVPSTRAWIDSVGVADLIVVKQQIIRYEPGEIAHIENVLKGETRKRKHRRSRTVEEFFLEETETELEEERDLESTTRSEMSEESQEVLKEDVKADANAKVWGKTGPTFNYEVGGNVAYSTAKEETRKEAVKFSKDVTERARNRVSERIRQQRTRRVVEEFEEENLHELKGGDEAHTSAVYQWVDKVYRAQLYSYGPRMMFDLMVPEPATILEQATKSTVNFREFKVTLNPSDPDHYLDPDDYLDKVSQYPGAIVKPPPEPYITVSKTVSSQRHKTSTEEGEGEAAESEVLTAAISIPVGYKAVAATVHWSMAACKPISQSFDVSSDPWLMFFVGDRRAMVNQTSTLDLTDNVDMATVIGYGTFASNGVTFAFQDEIYPNALEEVTQISVGMHVHCARSAVGSFEIKCVRTKRAIEQWQLVTLQALRQAHEEERRALEEQQAGSEISEGVRIEGRNPAENQRIIKTELKKLSISLFTRQHFDLFGAYQNRNSKTKSYPEINFWEAEAEGRYIRFFEQAFEWEHMNYVLYPYFWADKTTWNEKLSASDNDPDFKAFLQAGSARVQISVRRGFERAIEYFMKTGDTWEGGPLPEVGERTFVPIHQEIAERKQQPQDFVPIEEPWEYRVPTQLVKVRKDDRLPSWSLQNGEWQLLPDEPAGNG